MSNPLFDIPEGIEEGQLFADRKALIRAGLHRSTMHGIDGNGNEGVSAIVLSGGYEDDQDLGDEIIYTGHGGNDPVTKQQIQHQSWEDHGNKGLVVSEMRNLPVRVIRGYKHASPWSPDSGYRFAGIFKVMEHWEEMGKSGFKICRFRLRKISTLLDETSWAISDGMLVKLQSKDLDPKWFSIAADPPSALKAQRISAESTLAQRLMGKNVGDTIDFGAGFKILEIKRYLSK
jgi:predicted restriction endonuclease